MGERGKFEAAIEQAIESGDVAALAAARLVYADWLEERNTVANARLAVAQRWMVEHKRRPQRSSQTTYERFRWFRAEMRLSWYYPDASLEVDLFTRMVEAHPEERSATAPRWLSYRTRRAAEEALAEALAA